MAINDLKRKAMLKAKSEEKRNTARNAQASNETTTPTVRPLADRAIDRLMTADTIRSNNQNSSNAMDQWRAANADRIAGVAEMNNVDTGVAEAMLKSNIMGGTNHAGGGTADMNALRADLTSAQASSAADRARGQANDYLDRLYREQRAAMQGNINNTLRQIDSYRNNARADYEAQQRANYIAQQQAMNGLNDYLAARGLIGGAAETTAQGLAADYLTNRANADRNYNDTLLGIDQAYAEAQASGNTDLANLAAQMYQAYANQAAQDAQNQIQQNRWQAEFDAEQQRYNNSLAQQEYANALQRAQLAAQYGDYGALNNMLGTNIQSVQPAVYYRSQTEETPAETQGLSLRELLSNAWGALTNRAAQQQQPQNNWTGIMSRENGRYTADALRQMAINMRRAYGDDADTVRNALINGNLSDSDADLVFAFYQNLV